MTRDVQLVEAIATKDISAIKRMIFSGTPPEVRDGFKTETELWDYKSYGPPVSKSAERHDATWSAIAASVLAFHNKRGGIIIFGVNNDSFEVRLINSLIDSKIFNEKIWRYLSDRIWVEYHRLFVAKDQCYIGAAVVPARAERLERFINAAPPGCQYSFLSRQSAVREGDTTRILSEAEADTISRQLFLPTLGKPYIIDEPGFRVLQPEYDSFTYRDDLCSKIESSLVDTRVAVTSLIGIGGAGKTALATWATQRAYERKDFEFIVSITAKDRVLTTRGIHGLEPSLGSLETLLNAIIETLGFEKELLKLSSPEKADAVRILVEGTKGLLFVDNLETVDDARIINFLDELPLGVRAITTSRISRVKVSVRPIMVGPLSDDEILNFVRKLSAQAGMGYIEGLKDNACLKIGHACDGLPLAIAWILKRSGSGREAQVHADALVNSGTRKDELLEFCFRRVFEEMPQIQQEVMRTLSLYEEPLALEPIIAGCNRNPATIDAVDQLVEDSLIQRVFDEASDSYRFTLLPLVQSFVYSDTTAQGDLDRTLRRRLTAWFEATDVSDTNQRLIERQLRQGRQASDSSILALARQALQRGDVDSAQRLFEYALQINRKNYQAARELGELARHHRHSTSDALRYYQLAAEHAPRSGSEAALIYREWGMLLKESGLPNATDQAIEKLEQSLRFNSVDQLTRHALGDMYTRKQQFSKVIDVLTPLLSSNNVKSKRISLPLLIGAYESRRDIVEVARLKADLDKLPKETPRR